MHTIPMRKAKFKTRQSQKLPATVWWIGLSMCLVNTSFVMIFGISAVYLHSLMGVAVGWILVLEGLGEAASFLMKLFSGVISDYIHKRKPIILIGYGLILISKFILALSSTFGPVFASSLLERIGNGTQGTPRDALISDVAPMGKRGVAFGLKRSLGIAGSCMGALIGFCIMYYTKDSFHTVFWLALIPMFFAFFILFFIVKEPKYHQPFTSEAAPPQKRKRPISFSDLPLLGRHYWVLIGVVFLFMIARIGENALVLHSKRILNIKDTYAPLLIMLYNSTYSLSSYPIGKLADRMNRKKLLAFSMLVLVGSDVLLALSSSYLGMFMGIILWGVQMGAVQNVFMASIADMAPPELRGTAFGFYYLAIAAASIIAGVWGGQVSQAYGSSVAYVFSACIALLAVLTLLSLKPKLWVQGPETKVA